MSNSENIKIEDQDYPALFRSADQASIKAQNSYLGTIRWYLFSLITGALFTLLADASPVNGIIATILFLGSLFLFIFQQSRKHDTVWYNGRAVAESVKTRTWRFMMKAAPYQDFESLQEVSDAFSEDLFAILQQNRELGPHIGGEISAADQITEKMRTVRAMSFQERTAIYQRERIDDQRNWYARKSDLNNKTAHKWFLFLVLIHGLIIVLLLYKIYQPSLRYLPIETLIVAAGAMLTWIQLKRFQELATAYALAAHEIGIIKNQIERINSEQRLSDFVQDAENAFSREHTQWVARKDK